MVSGAGISFHLSTPCFVRYAHTLSIVWFSQVSLVKLLVDLARVARDLQASPEKALVARVAKDHLETMTMMLDHHINQMRDLPEVMTMDIIIIEGSFAQEFKLLSFWSGGYDCSELRLLLVKP